MKQIFLASASPRRKALLEQVCIPFEVIECNIDEDIDDEVSPYDLVKILSTRKVMNAIEKLKVENKFAENDTSIIVSADTIVSFKGKILGKPHDSKTAFDMIKKLQGNEHSVYTGMTIAFKKGNSIELKNVVSNTIVYMRTLMDDEILEYINTGEPLDKAGAYAIQGKGSMFIEKIEGDYYTVVGLPLFKLFSILKEHGINLNEIWTNK